MQPNKSEEFFQHLETTVVVFRHTVTHKAVHAIKFYCKLSIVEYQWRNYHPRSLRNAGGPDEKGAKNFRTNYSIHGRFLFEFAQLR